MAHLYAYQPMPGLPGGHAAHFEHGPYDGAQVLVNHTHRQVCFPAEFWSGRQVKMFAVSQDHDRIVIATPAGQDAYAGTGHWPNVYSWEP